MANPRKIFVVISDEDVIERLISNVQGNVQCIDLDRKKPLPEENRSSRIAKKWLGASCKICADQAIGFNYGVLTCAACKTFFRRYGDGKPEELPCLANAEQCSSSYQVRRKCPKCRLKKCLSSGMKKNWKPSEDSSQVSRIDSKVISDTLFGRLSVEDWLRLQSIQSSFLFFCDLSEEEDHARIDLSDHRSAMVSWSYVGSDNAMRLINFFRHLNEFEQLNADDRFILIKYNLFAIFLSSKGYYYKHPSKCSSPSTPKEEEEERGIQLLDLCDHSLYQLDRLDHLIIFLIQLTERDAIVVSLLSILLIFSPGISLDENEPPLKDPLAIYRIQSYFTEILYSYLIDKYDDVRAEQYLIRLFHFILRIQCGTRDLSLFLQHQYRITNSTEQIAPLMKTILHFS